MLVTLSLMPYRACIEECSRITFKNLDWSMVMCITPHRMDIRQYGGVRAPSVGRSAMLTVGEVLGKQLFLVPIFWVSWVSPTVPMTLPLHGNTGVPSGMNGSTQTKDSVSGANHDFKVMKNLLSFSSVLFSFNMH